MSFSDPYEPFLSGAGGTEDDEEDEQDQQSGADVSLNGPLGEVNPREPGADEDTQPAAQANFDGSTGQAARIEESGPIDREVPEINTEDWNPFSVNFQRTQRQSDADLTLDGGPLEMAYNFARTGQEQIIDNPALSIQDTIRGAATDVSGAGSDEEFAEDFQRANIETRRDARVISDTLAEAGEGTPLDADDESAQIDIEGDAGPVSVDSTFNTGEAVGNLGNFGSGVFDVFATDLYREGSKLFLGVDPLGGEQYNLPGGEGEDAEVTGDTGRVAQPLNYGLDVLFAGVGGGVASALSRSSGRFSGAIGGLLGRGSDNAIQGASSMSGSIDEFVRIGDDVVSGFSGKPITELDDISQATSGVDETFTAGSPETEAINFFGGIDESIGTSDNALAKSDTAIEEGTSPSSSETLSFIEQPQDDIDLSETIDESLDAENFGDDALETGEDIAGSLGDDLVGGGDDTTGFDETFTAGSPQEEATNFFGGVDDTVGGGGRVVDESTNVNRASDEGADVADDTAGGGGDGGGGGGFLSGFRSRASSLAPGRFGSALLGGGVLGAGALALDGSVDIGGGGGVNAADVPSQGGNGAWTWRQVEIFSAGNGAALMEISLAGSVAGYSVIVETSPLRVLTQDGGVTSASISMSQLRSGGQTIGQNAESGDVAHLEPVFNSRSGARQAYRSAVNEGGGNQPGGDSASGDSDLWDGSVEAPREVGPREGFNAEATIQNTANERRSANFVLAISTPSGTGRLTSTRQRVPGGETATISFSVASTIRRLEPGDYTLLVVAQGDGAGRVASQNFSVAGGNAGAESAVERSSWGEAEVVEELGSGWYLARQQEKNGSETRFMGVGQKGENQRIYLYPNGQVRKSPHFFDDADAVVQAFQTWRQRAQNGQTSPEETPNPAGGRPSGKDVRRDAAKKDVSGLGGILQTATANPLLTGAGLVAVFVGIYYVSNGNPVSWMQEQFGGVVDTVEGAVPM